MCVLYVYIGYRKFDESKIYVDLFCETVYVKVFSLQNSGNRDVCRLCIIRAMPNSTKTN